LTNQTTAPIRPRFPKSFRLAPLLAIAFATQATASPPTPIRYTCTDGRVITATYPDQSTATLTFAGQTQSLTLTLAPSADGARYIAPAWQWWTKGFHDAALAPLSPGETLATAPATPCHAPP